MNFSLKFQKSGDTLPFKVVCNHDLFKYFVEMTSSQNENLFHFEHPDNLTKLIEKLHNLILKINPITDKLIGKTFDSYTEFDRYLDQAYLNRIHAEWVKSQECVVNIDTLRHSQDHLVANLGWQLHEKFPDEIRNIRIAEALDKLGYLIGYEDINLTIHDIESQFQNPYLTLNAVGKWNVFDNPFKDTMTTNNNVTNFNFGYTYLGRQYLNKWEYYDSNLECDDHYNYQTLEFSFNINLSRPQTIPFSKEFLSWCTEHKLRPVGNQLPIANIVDIEDNLFKYRKIIYRNLKDRNTATIIIEE